MISIIKVKTEAEFLIAKNLFIEYANELDIDLCFQNFEEELKNIQIQYGDPTGALLLVRLNKDYIGCAGLRYLEMGTGELKRMYIKKEFRGKGYAKILLTEIIQEAKQLNFKKVKLDTLSSMKPAIQLYNSFQFIETGAYRYNPDSGARYFEKIIE